MLCRFVSFILGHFEGYLLPIIHLPYLEVRSRRLKAIFQIYIGPLVDHADLNALFRPDYVNLRDFHRLWLCYKVTTLFIEKDLGGSGLL